MGITRLYSDREPLKNASVFDSVTIVPVSVNESGLRLSDLRLGLIINFHVHRLTDGVTRVVNGFVESDEPFDPPDLRE